MRRQMLLVATLVIAFACGEDSLRREDLLGEYRLSTVNGQPLLFRMGEIDITNGTLIVSSDDSVFVSISGFSRPTGHAWVNYTSGTWAPTRNGLTIQGTSKITSMTLEDTILIGHYIVQPNQSLRLSYVRDH